MINFQSIILCAALLMVSCVQTRTFHKGKTFAELPRTDYIGTFAAIYYLHDKAAISIDQDLSLNSVYLNDSIIRKRVQKLNQPKSAITDSSTAQRVREALIRIVNYVKDHNSLKGLTIDPVFKTVGDKTSADYNTYFISTGFIKDPILRQAAINRSLMAGMATVMAGMAGYYVLSLNDRSVPDKAQGVTLEYKNSYEGTKGLRGFAIVYDKKANEICFYREQFFIAAKDPLNLSGINKQVKSVFKETYK